MKTNPTHALIKPDWYIRRLQLEDSFQIYRNCFPHLSPQFVRDFTARAYDHMLLSQGTALVAVSLAPSASSNSSQEVIAFGQIVQWKHDGEISDLVVAEKWRGKGIGTNLILALIQSAHRLHVDYVEIGAALNNPRALHLYLRLGFQPTRIQYLDVGNGNEPIQYLQLRLKPIL